MIEATGTVTGCDGAYAWVETERSSSCGSCSTKGCGTGALSKVLGARSHRVRVRNGLDARVGETVIVGISEDALLRGSFMVYIVPLLALLAGALLGETLAEQLLIGSKDLFTAAAGGLGLGAGLLWLRLYNFRSARNDRFQAVILRRVGVAPVVFHRPLNH